VFLDERHAQAVMGSAQGGNIAAGAGADDGEVISRITHARNLAVANPQANKRISTMRWPKENGMRIIGFRWRGFWRSVRDADG
jgi:hypothetical protein